MYDFTAYLVYFIALAPLFYFLGLVLSNGLRNIPVLGPLGRIIGAVCYLAAGAGGLAMAGAATMLVLGVLLASGWLVLLVLLPLVCLALLLRFIEPFISRAMAPSAGE